MSTGGIFQIIINEGRNDRMIMATARLRERINMILPTPNPTLNFTVTIVKSVNRKDDKAYMRI